MYRKIKQCLDWTSFKGTGTCTYDVKKCTDSDSVKAIMSGSPTHESIINRRTKEIKALKAMKLK